MLYYRLVTNYRHAVIAYQSQFLCFALADSAAVRLYKYFVLRRISLRFPLSFVA